MEWNTGYNMDGDAISRATGLKCEDKSLAKQSFAEEVDINTIIRRFGLSGELPQNVAMPLNVDFEEVFDYQSAMNVIRGAQEAFMEMPAHIRSRFSNDPALFMEFCSKEENRDEAIKLGLALKPVAAAPAPAAPAAAPAAAPVA